tara:strand:+ start:392 stop:652 length:261 start_codon:yes stop_codon:yes gene_type:complete
MYSSYPEQKVVGYFNIAQIVAGNPFFVWNLTNNLGCLSEDDFYDYFDQKENAFAYEITNLTIFDKPISLNDLQEGLKAPQDFCYLS